MIHFPLFCARPSWENMIGLIERFGLASNDAYIFDTMILSNLIRHDPLGILGSRGFTPGRLGFGKGPSKGRLQLLENR